jgi:hypothetical protein
MQGEDVKGKSKGKRNMVESRRHIHRKEEASFFSHSESQIITNFSFPIPHSE